MNHTMIYEVLVDSTKKQEILDSIVDRNKKVLLFLKVCQKLPDDIIRKIYEDYLKPEMLYEDLIYTLQTNSSKQLHAKPLINFIPKLLKNKIIVEYLFKNDCLFNDIYTKHIINKTNVFVNAVSTNASIAMTWLAYLYN